MDTPAQHNPEDATFGEVTIVVPGLPDGLRIGSAHTIRRLDNGHFVLEHTGWLSNGYDRFASSGPGDVSHPAGRLSNVRGDDGDCLGVCDVHCAQGR